MSTTLVNRLHHSSSPYLLQHAENPVHWQPWDEEALAIARQTNRPILLSIGYSSCHWCHVMAHESFEDPQTAELMNQWFVNIKVDREERPDLDKIYQSAFQLMHRSGGGWPLTAFLTPDDQVPFYIGTYFPPHSAHGRPAFKDVLAGVAEAWHSREAEIRDNDQAIYQAFERMLPKASATSLDAAPLQQVLSQLQESFDPQYGGFSPAPKFPHPGLLHQCLYIASFAASQASRQQALMMVEKTARHMALGGVFDHVGGGFYRYSTDNHWQIPHFEKMLYDNGQLLGFYADLYRHNADPLYQQTASGIASWVMGEMQAADGGYYAAQDADTEGEEGRYYVWSDEQLRQLLTPAEYALVSQRFSLDQPANFEGRWHLHADASRDDQALADDELARWEAARDKLVAVRAERVPPGIDDKVLTSWNALMIRGMVRAGRVFAQPDWIDSAARALDFIQANLWQDGRLLAAHRDGLSHLPAYLDDYAYLAEAILEMLSARFDPALLTWAEALADILLRDFQDNDQGGFFFTANDHETLVFRPKPLSDEAMPAGNGVAVKVLLRLGHLLGRTDLLEAAERTLNLSWQALTEFPLAYGSLLQGLQLHLQPLRSLVLRGPHPELANWQQALTAEYLAGLQLYSIPNDIDDLPAALAAKTAEDRVCAYLCEGLSCSAPIYQLDELMARLSSLPPSDTH